MGSRAGIRRDESKRVVSWSTEIEEILPGGIQRKVQMRGQEEAGVSLISLDRRMKPTKHSPHATACKNHGLGAVIVSGLISLHSSCHCIHVSNELSRCKAHRTRQAGS